MNTAGVHLLCELSGCDPNVLAELSNVREACEAAAASSGATIIAVNSHAFSPCGVSVLLFLADSHLSIHTWPEEGYAAVDIYTCGDAASPHNAIECLRERLRAEVADVREFLRGRPGDWPGYRSIEKEKKQTAQFSLTPGSGHSKRAHLLDEAQPLPIRVRSGGFTLD